MKTKILPLFFLLYSLFTSPLLWGQNTFSLDYDLDNTGIQNNMIDMEMNDEFLYILSLHICNEEEDEYFGCMRVSKFDLAGNLITSITNSNMAVTISVGLMGQSCDDCLTLHEGNLYISINHTDDDFDNVHLYKYDQDLNLIDLHTYPFTNSDSYVVNEGNTIIDNNIYLYGNVKNDVETADSARIINANLDGSINWTQYYSFGDDKMNINSLQLKPDGNLSMILCHTTGPGPDQIDPERIIVDLTQSGEMISTYSVDMDYNQQNRLVISNDNGYYFLTDQHPITGFDGQSHGRINKLNPNMEDFEWSIRLPNHGIMDGRNYKTEDIIQAQNGDFITCGTVRDDTDTDTPGSGLNSTWNGFMIRTTPSGEIVWLRIFRNENDIALPTSEFGRFRPSYLRKVRELPDGRIIAAGSLTLNGLQTTQIDYLEDENMLLWLIVVDENGCLEDFPCQELIRLDSATQVTPPLFPIGTQWTYEFFPESEDDNEIIHSFITYEITDTATIDGHLEYYVENNRDLPELKLRQADREVWIHNNEYDQWQLTYDFNANFTYYTPYEDDDEVPVNVTTDFSMILWIGDRGLHPIQEATIYDNMQDTLVHKEILNTIGPLHGGLTFEDHPQIKEIRCFEEGDYFYNFSGSFFTIPCDSVWTELINHTNEYAYQNRITISPNPTTEIITIQGLSQEVPYEIYGIDGILLETGVTKNHQLRLKHSGLQILNITIDDKQFIFKAIKLGG